jgi:hypothetical protein
MVGTAPAAAVERSAADERRSLRAAASRGRNPAVLALLDTAERELSAGRPERAAALLERALAIEPRNPTAWHYLGLANLELGNSAQAEAMAAKSRSLVEGDEGFREWASRTVIEPARSFIDGGRAPRGDAEPQRWPPVEAATRAWRDVRSLASRDRNVAVERAQREREAQRAEQARRSEEARRAIEARRAEMRLRSELEQRDRSNEADDRRNRARGGTWL